MRHLLTLGLTAALLAALPARAYVNLQDTYGAWVSTEHRTMPHTAGGNGTAAVNLSGATDPTSDTVAHLTSAHATAGHATWVEGTNPIGTAKEFAVYEVVSGTQPVGTPVEVRVRWWGDWAGNVGSTFNLGLEGYQAVCSGVGTCDPFWGDLAFDVSWLKTPAVLHQGGTATMTDFSGSFSLDVGLKKWELYDPWDPWSGGHWVDLEVGDLFTLRSFTVVEAYQGNAAAQEHHKVNLPLGTLLGVQALPIAPDVPVVLPEPASALLVAPLAALLVRRRRSGRR